MESLGDRNNTSFAYNLSKLVGKIEDDVLQEHQAILHNYLMYTKARGVLAFQGMGSGKSIVAVSCCETVRERYPAYKILMITSRSLRENMIENIKKYLGLRGVPAEEIEEHISRYTFISLNAGNMLDQVRRSKREDLGIEEEDPHLEKIKELSNLNDSFLVIDEAHNFFNSVANGSKNAIGLYRLIMAAKRIKLLFLTGSPIINDPFEIAICYNLLAGPVSNGQGSLFGEDYQTFLKYFVQNPRGTDPDSDINLLPSIKNADKFANRIMGLTSYYEVQGETKKLFPELLELKVIEVPMEDEQYASYVVAREKEIEEGKRKFRGKALPLQKPGSSSSSYRVRSRQISNGANKIRAMLEAIASHMPPEVLKDFRKEVRGIGITLVYSQFLESGILAVAQALQENGFREVKNGEDLAKARKHRGGTYAIISGEVDTKVRAELLKFIFCEDNMRGELVNVLLFTSTGAEGMDTLYVRAVLAMEPYWHWARLSQVFARGPRLGSHVALPEKERNVQPYLFLSGYPDEDTPRVTKLRELEETTDVTLYTKARQNLKLIEEFLLVIKQTSIDCTRWRDDCRVCAPTDRKLWLEDLDQDLSYSSPCEILEKEKVKVKKLMVGKEEIMYNVDDRLHVYIFNTEVNGYQELDPQDSLYKKVERLLA